MASSARAGIGIPVHSTVGVTGSLANEKQLRLVPWT
jgi:hypothetical protein